MITLSLIALLSATPAPPPSALRVGKPVILGKVPAAATRQALDRSAGTFSKCFGTRVPSGQLTLRIIIDAQGRVSSAAVVGGALQSMPVAGCVTAAASALRFPAPAQSGIAILRVPLYWQKPDAQRALLKLLDRPRLLPPHRVSTSDPPSKVVHIKSDKAIILGSLGKDQIRSVVLESMDAVEACSERRADTTGQGQIVVRWVIDGEGRVPDADIKQDDLADAKLLDCLIEVVHTYRFPSPKGGGIVIVNYPFLFRAASEQARR